VDYLLKPFDEERLGAAIGRARERISGQQGVLLAQQLQTLLELTGHKWPERLSFRNGDGFSLVPVDTVDWIESANNYVVIHCGPKHHVMGETLTNLESRLNPDKFLRIHRCRIVNVSRVVAVRPFLSGTYQLELNNGARLTTGKQHNDAVRRLIKK
jgi:two-component system LytT family response regulator